MIPSKIPIFLKDFANQIFLSGKYINVIKEFSPELNLPGRLVKPLHSEIFDLNSDFIRESVFEVYQWSNDQLMKIIKKEQKLFECFGSIKHFFFGDCGDLILHFLDLSSDELKKNVSLVVQDKLQNFLEIAINKSVFNSDIFKNNVKVSISKFSHWDTLYALCVQNNDLPNISLLAESPSSSSIQRGYENIIFELEIPFPLNLLLSSQEIIIYQTYSRYIFFLRYCQRQISKLYLKLREEKMLFNHPFIKRCFDFVHKMLRLNQTLIFHFVFDVFNEHFQKFMLNIQRIEEFQTLKRSHHQFINQLGQKSFLFENDFKETVCKMHIFFIMFCNNLKGLLNSFKVSDENYFSDEDSDYDANEMEYILFYIYNLAVICITRINKKSKMK